MFYFGVKKPSARLAASTAVTTVLVLVASLLALPSAAMAKDPGTASISGSIDGITSASTTETTTIVSGTATLSSPTYNATVQIDSSGHYEFPALAEDAYQLEINGLSGANGDQNIWPTEWYNNFHDGQADEISVLDGENVDIDVTLDRFAIVSGTVRSKLDTSDKLDGVEIELQDFNSGNIYTAVTNSNGDYSIGEVIPSTYIVLYRYKGVDQYYGGVYASDQTFPFIVDYNQTIDRDEDLLWTGEIHGRLRDTSTGDGIPGATVQAYLLGSDSAAGSVVSDSDGNYVVDGLESGAYQIKFSKNGYFPRWYTAEDRDSSGTIGMGPGVSTEALENLEPAPQFEKGTASISWTETPKTGTVLTLTTTEWGPAPVTTNYQWFRSGASYGDGSPISGATGSTYTVTNADHGAQVYVVGYFTKDGYIDETITTNKTPEIPRILGPTSAPVVTAAGTNQGDRLSANTTPWGPSPVTFSYQWTRDSQNIPGAIYNTYNLQTDDRGKQIRVVLTGTKSGYPSVSLTSNATAASGDAYTTEGIVSITGDPTLASTLTATVTGFNPTPYQYFYVWQRDGVAISGATAREYTLVSADVGAKITVSATTSRQPYSIVTVTSDETATITTKTFTTSSVPSVYGTPRVGLTVNTDYGTWDPNARLSYVWKTGTDVVGTTDYYELKQADIGKQLTVTVTGTNPAYTTISRQSEPVTVTGYRWTRNNPSGISGRISVGATLTATGPSQAWEPTPTGYIYQWTRNGTNIDGATASTYTLVDADLAQTIAVRMSGVREFYETNWVTSTTVTPTSRTLYSTNLGITYYPHVGTQATGDPGTWGPGDVTLSYRWLRADVAIPNATSLTYTPIDDDAGEYLTFEVTGTQAGFDPLVKTVRADAVTDGGTLTSAIPVLTGTGVVGDPITATVEGWSAGTVFTLSWYAGVDVVQNGGYTFTPTNAQAGKVVYLRVYGERVGRGQTTRSSDTIPITGGTFETNGQLSVSGTFVVGNIVAAVVPDDAFTPTPFEYLYEWKSGGVTIPNATSFNYRLRNADAGHTVSVEVTAERTGFAPTPRESTQSPLITGGTLDGGAASIEGEERVGETLTAVGSSFADGVSLTYEWTRDDKVVGDDDEYLLTNADAGFTVFLKITGTKTGFNPSYRYDNTTDIMGGTLTSVTPSIIGDVEVGEELSIDTSGWTPGTNFTYQWSNNFGTVSEQETYTPTNAVAGTSLSVSVVGTKYGFGTVPSAISDGVLVTGGTFEVAAEPSLDDVQHVGVWTGVKIGTLVPTATALAYQWKRDGVDIPGTLARAQSYQPVNDDAGTVLSVEITYSRPGFASITREAVGSSIVIGGQMDSGKVAFAGAGRAGSALTVRLTGWKPGTTFTYVWYVDGAERSTKSSFTPTAADVGKSIGVDITGTKPGFFPYLEWASGLIVTGGKFTAVKPVITGTAAPGGVLTGVPAQFSPYPDNFVSQWTRNGVAIKGAIFPSYKLTTADAGKTIAFSQTATRLYYDAATSVSATVTVKKLLTTTPTPKVSGTFKVGKKLTAKTTTWKPTKVALSYQWKRDGKAISGAKSSTYKLKKADKKHKISVSITGSKSGYVSVTKTSAAKKVK